MKPQTCHPDNAVQLWTWLLTRGGIFIWNSIDLSDLGKSWSTPAKQEDGKPGERPIWKADYQPARHITQHEDVVVETPKEVKRFRVAIRPGAQGLSLKVTDAGSKRIRTEITKASEKYGTEAWHVFDYETQEAVIRVADTTVPLRDYI